MQQTGTVITHVTEALNCNFGLLRHNIEQFFKAAQHIHAAPTCGVGAAQGPAQTQGFAGDHTWIFAAFNAVVLVAHPAHDNFVGVHIRGRNIHFGADHIGNHFDIGAAQALQFGFGQLFGVDTNAPFGPPKGNAHHRAFKGHPKSQGHDLVEGDVLVVANPALGRPT